MDDLKLSPIAGRTFRLAGRAPVVDPTAWIAPSASVIGDVEIGPQSGLWFNVVLRADSNSIRVGARTNLQDGTIVHVDPGAMRVEIGDDVTVGHNCIIHGCTLEDGAFVGMGAILMNGVRVKAGGVVAAGAVVPEGRLVREGELWAGVPARLLRHVSQEEIRSFGAVSRSYVERIAFFRSLCPA